MMGLYLRSCPGLAQTIPPGRPAVAFAYCLLRFPAIYYLCWIKLPNEAFIRKKMFITESNHFSIISRGFFSGRGGITLRLYLYIGVTHVAGVEEVLPLLWIFGGRVAGGKMAWYRAGVCLLHFN